ncbi:MAG: hypothetical protein ACYTF6_07450 [Planctomycetota bacterium]
MPSLHHYWTSPELEHLSPDERRRMLWRCWKPVLKRTWALCVVPFLAVFGCPGFISSARWPLAGQIIAICVWFLFVIAIAILAFLQLGKIQRQMFESHVAESLRQHNTGRKAGESD